MVHLESVRTLSADELVSGVKELLADERLLLAKIVGHLAAIEHKHIYLDRGYPSMFRFAVDDLGMSKGQAGHRITAARLLLRFPIIEHFVAEGKLHLSGLKLIGPRLTEANHREILEAGAGKTRDELKELLAALFPKSDVLPLIVPNPAAPSGEPEQGRPPTGTAATRAPSASSASRTQPVSADSFSVTFTLDRQGHDKLLHAQSLLRGAVRNGDLGQVVLRALDVLIPKLERQKFGITDKPRRRRNPADPHSRHVPAEIRRQVVARDGLRCAFVAADGTRCSATEHLQFHHVDPYGRGGPMTVANIEMRCAAHKIGPGALPGVVQRCDGARRGLSHQAALCRGWP